MGGMENISSLNVDPHSLYYYKQITRWFLQLFYTFSSLRARSMPFIINLREERKKKQANQISFNKITLGSSEEITTTTKNTFVNKITINFYFLFSKSTFLQKKKKKNCKWPFLNHKLTQWTPVSLTYICKKEKKKKRSLLFTVFPIHPLFNLFSFAHK